MFLNKNWKFYSPIHPPVGPTPVEDDSLSKNYTDNVDASKTFEPVAPLEKMFAKMAGDDIDLPTPTNALEYQVKRVAENGVSGGGSGALIVHIDDRYTLDKTWQEIFDYSASGPVLLVLDDAESKTILQLYFAQNGGKGCDLYFYSFDNGDATRFTTEDPSGYPVQQN